MLQLLQEAGLTGYQARAYVSLLRTGSARVLALARASGVPRNKLYSVLEDLERMGLVMRASEDPLEYAPLPLKAFLEAKIRRLQSLLDQVEAPLGAQAGRSGGGEGDPYLTRSANAYPDAG